MTNTLVVCVVFLCGLEEVLSQHGRCIGTQCFALFQELSDFPDAEKSCKNSGGQLKRSDLGGMEPIQMIIRNQSGSFWLGPGRTTREAAPGIQQCSSISSSLELSWEPCQNLNGFLCEYTLDEPCSGLQVSAGAQVTYTSMGFEVRDSQTFPQGTVAVTGQVGAAHPDAKHVCFAGDWIQAPWTCEVLQGGCKHGCNSTNTCTCPAGQTLHGNRITCVADPCAACAHECLREGDAHVCKCRKGYKPDGEACVDVDECEEGEPCTGEGEECVNTPGNFECTCKDGFVAEDGVCEDVSVCDKCEHILCDKIDGVYGCLCRKGFKVSDKDPHKCEMHCTERDCPAQCLTNIGKQKKDCFCPKGYLLDVHNGTNTCTDINECDEMLSLCDHTCENTFGDYKCSCKDGFKLLKKYTCVPHEEEEEEEEGGSGSAPPHPTPAGSHPASVPSYIKTGSVLGIGVFMALCALLLVFVVHNAVKRCGKFEISSIKHSNIDIFYLQQVTTETYKRLSFDKPLKNDSQIL